ncbi:WYL domain-containing protein [Corynebacterium kefirresidentii]|uniref:WYL domain-containing protein n=1 Tax=Corynebacterium kefirresidentii TaxID=1979527 RepID=A0ABT8Q223_9CORY|nr:WYL domain-containing protein [Corynebacterium kefirresidentii]MDN8619380.1 WYL domain-containing protein [Corynebacterium kefirresidentii]MDN8641463.1 WYL domain-containing protein [Corynebacterium kefirresidentii]
MAAHNPTPKRHDEAVERLTNLSFALQGAANSGGSPDRSAAWIRRHVAGYGDKSGEAFAKSLARDIATLQRAGVPIVHSGGEDGARYRLDASSYQLPSVEFSPEEAMVLGIAGGMGTTGGLSDFSLSGWTKIAASGASRNLSGAPVYTAVNDITRLAPEVITSVLAAVRNRLRITFSYRANPAAKPVRRVMDPWGVVNRDSHIYIVGFDVDRGAPRVFRALRVSDIKRSHHPAEHTVPTETLQVLVERALQRGEKVDARLIIPVGKAQELMDAGEKQPDGTVMLRNVDKDWLVRTAAGYAPEVEVLEPAVVREEVISLLRTAARPQEGR